MGPGVPSLGLSLTQRLAALDPARRRAFLESCSSDELKMIQAEVANAREQGRGAPLPHQVIPTPFDKRGFLFRGSRRAGKTEALSRNGIQHMQGPPCSDRVAGGHQVLVVGRTAGEAVIALGRGSSSIPALWPGAALRTTAGGTYIVTPTGVMINLMGAGSSDDVEAARAKGGNCLLLCDELAAWKYAVEIWENLMLGLSLGPSAFWIAATTPRNRPLYKRLLADPEVMDRHISLFDNPYLSQAYKDEMRRQYDGTRIGRQELYGELIEDVEGAQWTYELVEAAKLEGEINAMALAAKMRRIAVGVDPSGSEDGDETGIIVVGIDDNDVIYILADHSVAGTAEQRFSEVCKAAHKWSAGVIVHEAQFSGDNYGYGIQQAWKELAKRGIVGSLCPRVKRTAARGSKADRMAPVVARYEQGYVKHVPGLAKLENQQVSWEETANWSPDRIDGLVYGVREVAGSSLLTMLPSAGAGRTSSAAQGVGAVSSGAQLPSGIAPPPQDPAELITTLATLGDHRLGFQHSGQN